MIWLKQKDNEPLFPDVLWSRPENRRYAGKLLIIGGHKQEFNQVSAAYTAGLKAGAGNVRVILPSSLQRTLYKLFPEAEYAAANQIGSFSREALSAWLDEAVWADAVLLAGDFGRNSETAVLLESFIEKYSGKLAVAGDSIDYFFKNPESLIKRANTLIVGDLPQIQKLAAPVLIQQKADLIKVVEQISDWVSVTDLAIVTVHSDKAIVAVKQQLSTSPLNISVPDINLAAFTTVWWLQHPSRSFEALTSAIFDYEDGINLSKEY